MTAVETGSECAAVAPFVSASGCEDEDVAAASGCVAGVAECGSVPAAAAGELAEAAGVFEAAGGGGGGVGAAMTFALPKSINFRWPAVDNSRFSGLRSLCTWEEETRCHENK